MKIVTSITVPDEVYLYFLKISEKVGTFTPEEIMADTLLVFVSKATKNISLLSTGYDPS